MRRSFWVGLALTAGLWLALVAVAVALVGTVASCHTHLLPVPDSPACVHDAWPAPWAPWVTLAIVGVVVVGTAVSGWRYLGGHRRRTRSFLARLLAASMPAEAPLSALAAEAGVGRIEVLDVDTPFAFTRGYIRPTVVVSTGLLQDASDDALQAILFHEAAHVRRRDPLRLSVGRVAAAAMWPFPVVRALVAHAETASEVAADIAALNRVERRPLLRGLRVVQGWESVPGDAAVSSACGRLAPRLRYLADGDLPRLEVPRMSVHLTALSVATVALAVTVLATAASRVGILP